jgi:hypothetical protein
VKPSYTYAAAGDYAVSLTVYDASGLKNSAGSVALISMMQPGSTNGVVYDGKQPMVGAHVYLMAANTTGYGQPSVSLLKAAVTGHSDAIGAYLLTGTDGGFTWPGGAACAAGSELYVYALGGAAAGEANSAAGLMAALGSCPNTGSFSGLGYVWVNEVSTVAAAYALAGFATDAVHVSSSGTAAALTGIAKAFANAANMTSLGTGLAYVHAGRERRCAAGRDQYPGGYSVGLRGERRGQLEQLCDSVCGQCGRRIAGGGSDGYGNGGDQHCA